MRPRLLIPLILCSLLVLVELVVVPKGPQQPASLVAYPSLHRGDLMPSAIHVLPGAGETITLELQRLPGSEARLRF